ncbi:MAG: DUF1643 domain-containing protein [Eubacteriaceae bacterium]
MEKWIYQTNTDNTARYVLGTEGKNPLIVMSINPSIGAPDVTDPTLGTVRHIAEDYHYDSWIILALYPQRATHLKNLDEMENQEWETENLKVINEVLAAHPDARIWAAWGTHIHDRWFFPGCLKSVMEIADKYNDSWMNYGPLTEHGDPRYCLYLEGGEGWSDFNIHQYYANLQI